MFLPLSCSWGPPICLKSSSSEFKEYAFCSTPKRDPGVPAALGILQSILGKSDLCLGPIKPLLLPPKLCKPYPSCLCAWFSPKVLKALSCTTFSFQDNPFEEGCVHPIRAKGALKDIFFFSQLSYRYLIGFALQTSG